MNMNDMIVWCNSNQGFVMVLLTFVYVIATVAIVMLAKRANKIALSNLKTLEELEREKSRPFIDVEIVADAPFLSLQISNQGLTPAYNVKVSMTPNLLYLSGRGKDTALGILEHGIGSLAAGANTTTLIGSFRDLKETNPSLQFNGTATFNGVDNQGHETPIHIDLRWMESNSSIHRKTIHDVANQLEKLQKEFHHFATGFYKPHIITQDAWNKNAEDRVRHNEFLASQKDKAKNTNKA